MSKPLIIDLKDFIESNSPEDVFEDELIIFELNYIKSNEEKNSIRMPPLRINAYTIFFAIHGEMFINIDYAKYRISRNMLLQLSSFYIMDEIILTQDFKGYMIIISMDMFNLIKNESSSIRTLGMESNLFQPQQQLENNEALLIEEIINKTRKDIKRTDHVFQKYLIKNNISNLLMEIAEINIKKSQAEKLNAVYGHKERIIQKFVKLLISHCKEQHQVSFYADKLCMTSENLSRIVKEFSGITANVWINCAILAEAKILLRKPKISVQQVAEDLNFGDQSSFGKFFKKHTNITPSEYKEKQFY